MGGCLREWMRRSVWGVYTATAARDTTPPRIVTPSPPWIGLSAPRSTRSVRVSDHQHELPLPNRASEELSNSGAQDDALALLPKPAPPQLVTTLNLNSRAGAVSDSAEDTTMGGGKGECVGEREGEGV